jgi:hypothetical protein
LSKPTEIYNHVEYKVKWYDQYHNFTDYKFFTELNGLKEYAEVVKKENNWSGYIISTIHTESVDYQ